MNQSGIYNSLEEVKLDASRFHTTIHCHKYPTLDGFYSLIARRLHFPSYFGKNLDALEECLTDLDWINEKQLVIEFRESDKLLHDEPEENRDIIWDIFTDATSFWQNKELELIVIKDYG